MEYRLFTLESIHSNISTQIPGILDNLETMADMILNSSSLGYNPSLIQHHCETKACFLDETVQSLKSELDSVKTLVDDGIEQDVNEYSSVNREIQVLEHQLNITEQDLLFNQKKVKRMEDALQRRRKQQNIANGTVLTVQRNYFKSVRAVEKSLIVSSVSDEFINRFRFFKKRSGKFEMEQDRKKIFYAKKVKADLDEQVEKLCTDLVSITDDINNIRYKEIRLRIKIEARKTYKDLLEESNFRMANLLSTLNDSYHAVTIASGRTHVLYIRSKQGYEFDRLKSSFEAVLDSFLLISNMSVFRTCSTTQNRIENLQTSIDNASTTVIESYNENKLMWILMIVIVTLVVELSLFQAYMYLYI